MALVRTLRHEAGRHATRRREETGCFGEIGCSRAVGFGVDRSSNGTGPEAATRLIGLRAARCADERGGICQKGRVDRIDDGDDWARPWDHRNVSASCAKVKVIDTLGKGA